MHSPPHLKRGNRIRRVQVPEVDEVFAIFMKFYGPKAAATAVPGVLCKRHLWLNYPKVLS